MYCQACGAYNPAGSSACLKCGALLISEVDPAGPKCRLHPERPAAGTCHRCGSFGCSVCLTQKGAVWLCADCVARGSALPWDERESLGTWRAWWRTSVQMISSPMATLEGAKPEGSLGGSLLFTLLSTLVGYGPTLAIYLLIIIPAMLWGASKSELSIAAGAMVSAGTAIYVVLLLALQAVGVFILAGLDHLMLMMLGAQPRDYSVSVRANALALGPSLVGLVPVCGLYVFPLWALVLRIIALMTLHKTTAGKAVLAVFIPIVLICGVCGAGYFFAFAAGMSRVFR